MALNANFIVHFYQDKQINLTLGDTTIAEFKMKWGKQTLYAEKEVNNLVNEVLAIGKSGEFELMIVGNKVKLPQGIMAKLFLSNN
ncbi:hypothetical protein RND71_038708 [Anisodus tanguticus]|uniref:Uncharacterized protein n=1 Tax=Anisodus tanguticus TaxID=243964 RepID=A0AAE1UTS1_9SOLA|nr:hypothetical protein RND71_038708 [Anisodus tanguticus]